MDSTVIAWRKQKRLELLAMRQELSAAARHHAAAIVGEKLTRLVLPRVRVAVGFYWPIRQEINLLSWARELANAGRVILALPVVVAPRTPVRYRLWRPDAPMRPDGWGIPVPVDTETILPDVVLAPLVGFDPARYRLGYGGGYFDRTLAAASPRPLAVGVGYAASRLQSILPQPHDIAMDAILTEQADTLPLAWSDHAP